ncbi:MAG: hypothetical protein JWN80_2261 [Microbacteriaceae bacterium]|jgi:hypothetical protein|nr:hypothetical protein [Microbacteriaceae bacterium]
MIWLIPVGVVLLALVAGLAWFSVAMLSEVAVELETDTDR